MIFNISNYYFAALTTNGSPTTINKRCLIETDGSCSFDFSNKFPCYGVATTTAMGHVWTGYDIKWQNSYSQGIPFTTPGNGVTTGISFSATLKHYSITGANHYGEADWHWVILDKEFKTTQGSPNFHAMVDYARQNAIADNSFTLDLLTVNQTTTISTTFSGLNLNPNTTYYVYIYDNREGSHYSMCTLEDMTMTSSVCAIVASTSVETRPMGSTYTIIPDNDVIEHIGSTYGFEYSIPSGIITLTNTNYYIDYYYSLVIP